jgi:hypothetical protein
LSRRPNIFRQTDLTRALKGARAAGIEIQRVEIDKDGKIIVVTGEPKEAIQGDETPEDLRELI